MDDKVGAFEAARKVLLEQARSQARRSVERERLLAEKKADDAATRQQEIEAELRREARSISPAHTVSKVV
ncbi:MAG: hypothetical protein AB1641_11100 [Thermodesulfobacteriota bacterium]